MVRSTVVLVLSAALGGCYPDVTPAELLDGGYKASGIVRLLAAQRSDQVAGGNAILGDAAPLGVGGRASGQVRVTTVSRQVPRMAGVPISTQEPAFSTIPTERETATSISAEGAVGVWPGFRVGNGRLLGIDLVGGVSLLSGFSSGDLNLEGGNVAVAGGVRLGVLGETAGTPGVTMTFNYRKLPSLTMHSDPFATTDGTIAFDAPNLRLSSTGVRFAASKQWGRWGATLGYGADLVQIRGDLTVRGQGGGRPEVSSTTTDEGDVSRTNLYGGVSYRFGGVAVVGEVGRLSGGDDLDEINNRFDAGWGRNYLTVGVRVGP